MRRIIVLVGLMMFFPSAYAQSPPDLPVPPAMPPQQPVQDIKLTPQYSAPVVQQTAANAGMVKPGDQVRLKRGTYVYSGPSEQSYRCGRLEGGGSVVLLDLPSPGSDFTAIASPDRCYSLIPISAVHSWWAITVNLKSLMNKPQTTLKPVETLIYGESPTGDYLASGYTLPKGSIVTILDEKCFKLRGKEEVYCVIRSAGKEKRFVHTADLEGVAEAAQAANSGMPAMPMGNSYGDNRAQQQNWQNHTPVQQPGIEGDQLPAATASQVQAADQAYRTALHYGAWEDARQRYMHLLESDVLSVRILAKNRLEFINDWQRNPPTVTTAMTPQQGAGLFPTVNHEPWVPGSQVTARPAYSAAANVPAPVKDVIIKPNQPTVPANNPAITVPTYPGPGSAAGPQQQQPSGSTAQATVQPQGQPVSRPAVGTAAPAATTATQRQKIVGKLNRAVQYTGPNQLYYLTNSQGYLTYYARSISSSGVKLDGYLGRNIEVEGDVVQAMIDGQKKPQINVVGVRPLQ